MYLRLTFSLTITEFIWEIIGKKEFGLLAASAAFAVLPILSPFNVRLLRASLRERRAAVPQPSHKGRSHWMLQHVEIQENVLEVNVVY